MPPRRTRSTTPGSDAGGAIVKRYRKRDRQFIYGLRIRFQGQRVWVPLGTEREGWNEVRAADARDEIASLIRRGTWRPPTGHAVDPGEKDPGFHEFASDWFTRYRQTVKPRTAEIAQNMLSRHALPYLHPYRLSDIDYVLLATYVEQKLKRNDEIALAAEVGVTLRDAAGRPRRPLSPRTINMSLDVISRVLNDAVKRKLIATNPAADRALRLKAAQHKRNSLEADELLALINAAGTLDEPRSPRTLARAARARRLRAAGLSWKEIGADLGVVDTTAFWLAGRHPDGRHRGVRRAIVATLGCAGLRNSELCNLNVADLDFAHSVFIVRDAKTEAGIRRVSMTPWLRDELLAYLAARPHAQPDDPAFPTRTGRRRDRNNINRRVVAPALATANAARPDRPLPDAITAHTFRRTYITLMLEAGAPVPYVQSQVGHQDATTTLNIYAQVLRRRDRTQHGKAFDALMTDVVTPTAPDTTALDPLTPNRPHFPSDPGLS